MERRTVRQDADGRLTRDGIRIHQQSDFAGMHAAGELAARILDELAERVDVGVTTGELDDYIRNRVEETGATSATIGYKGYQHASCISINHVVCHGIPGEKKLKDGDILNIDVTVIVDGWYGDSSRMYVAGKLSRKAERLIQVTHDSLMKGIPGAWKDSSEPRMKNALPMLEGAIISMVRLPEELKWRVVPLVNKSAAPSLTK